MTDQKQQVETLKAKIYDFFWVQFDEKTAKQVKLHPDRAIPILTEYMSTTYVSRNRLAAFRDAIEVILELHTISENKLSKVL